MTPAATPPLRLREAQDSLTVQFDAQLFAWQVRGGISNYFANMIAEFSMNTGLQIKVTGIPQFTQNLQAIETGVGRPLPRLVPHRVRAIRAMNAPGQLLSATRHRDLVHYTYYANERLRTRRGVTRVVTVHDMIPELFPELYPSGNPHQFKLAHVRQADLVLCNSQTTRDDLLNLVPHVADRVRVTPLGVSAAYFASVPNASTMSPPVSRPFVLFVGTRNHYKNFDVVLRAMSRIDHGVDLVLAGGGPLTSTEGERIDALGLRGRVRLTTPSDDELRQLYRSALAFVFPSRYEGFGLPVIESMASGCPTLLARTSVFVEIADDDAKYFEPDDDAELVALIESLLADEALRESMSRRGREQAARYTWSNTAQFTAAAYREAKDA